MVTIKISNRAMYSLIAVIIVIAIAGITYASTYANPATGVGHDASELDDVCRWQGGQWVDCPVVYTGNVIYQYPAPEYTNDKCVPTCNASLVSLPDTEAAPSCQNYINQVSSTSSSVCRSGGRTLCHSEISSSTFTSGTITYSCALEVTQQAKIVTYEFDITENPNA